MPVILDENGAVHHADFTKTGLPTHIQPPSDVPAGTPFRSRYGNPYLFNGCRWDGELGLYPPAADLPLTATATSTPSRAASPPATPSATGAMG